MSNKVAVPKANPFANYQRQMTRAFPGTLLRFVKGDWTVGKDGDVLAAGAQLVPVMDKLMIGWPFWQGGEPSDARMGFYVDGFMPPKRRELADVDKASWEIGANGEPRDPWAYTNALPLVSLDLSKVYTFTTSSSGGRTAVDDLCMYHSAASLGMYPLVALEASSYMHSKREIGRVKVPVFRVVGKVDAAPYDRAVAQALGALAASTETPHPASSISYLKPAIGDMSREAPPPIEAVPDGPDDEIPF